MKTLIVSLLIIFQGIPAISQNTSLSQQEKEAILFMREEEKLARDVYDSLFRKWGGNPFDNIRKSEQVHMDRMKELVIRYKLEDPVEANQDMPGKFLNNLLQQYYNELVASGSQSLTEALRAGAKVEELDIRDLEERMEQTDKQDIISTFTYLKRASENHLRAFARRLKRMGVDYEPLILGKDQYDKILATDNMRGSNRPNRPGASHF